MKEKTRSVIKEILPPFLVRWVNCYVESRYGFHGDYPHWKDVCAASGGYGNQEIFLKVKEAALRVKRGEAAYEQDSVLHNKISYNWPVLAGLLRIAALNNNRLKVLDYGGSLGSGYFQNRTFLSTLSSLKWCIVEQKDFVSWGKQHFEDEHLGFFYDMKSCLDDGRVDVALLSSVLSYLERPYDVLENIYSYDIPYLIIDRYPLLANGNRDRLTVQRVRPAIYRADYPAWFFNRDKFMDFIKPKYRIIASFDCPMRASIKSEFKGFILEKRK